MNTYQKNYFYPYLNGVSQQVGVVILNYIYLMFISNY